MGKCATALFCVSFLLASCSPRETTEGDDAEWADIQPLTNSEPDSLDTTRRLVASDGEDYGPLMRRLEEVESLDRAPGETLITGKTLVLNYNQRFVRMDEEVQVVDDHGSLKTETLLGRFSEDNRVEMVEARRNVELFGGGREARADNAVYVFEDGAIQLDGNAEVSAEGSRLSGDRIRFWVKGDRRVECEPNAQLEISGGADLISGVAASTETLTKIYSDRLIFNEENGLAEFDGNVRIRDARARMNSDKVLLHLKENNEIDWIEALFGVIIQSEGRKAIAERASYYSDEGKFILEGDPKVLDGRHVMTGDRISFWHGTQRMVCEPNARVLLYLDEEMKAKFLKDLKD